MQFSNRMIHISFLLITFLFQMMKDEKYILVDSEESLASLLADLEQYDMAAVDTEADSITRLVSASSRLPLANTIILWTRFVGWTLHRCSRHVQCRR